MEFTNTFSVEAPLDQVWGLLMQPEEVTGCVPGASITEKIDDRHFNGTVKVKLGAVQVTYRGEMEMQPDESSHTIMLTGKGTEARGSGGASGGMTVSLAPQGDATEVKIDSQVDVTGKVATFGRGIMQDLANRLTKQFATCLATKLEGTSVVQAPGSAAAMPPDQVQAGEEIPAFPPRSQDSLSQRRQTSPAMQTETRPTAPSQPQELRIADILADIARARAAAVLRALASWIEPK